MFLEEKVKAKIRFEIEQIDKLLDSYKELFNPQQDEEPDLIDITEMASVLHSFYNGAENIFLLISKNIDQHTPEGNLWHRDLLNRMSKKTIQRAPIISMELKGKLEKYLTFRHHFFSGFSQTFLLRKC